MKYLYCFVAMLVLSVAPASAATLGWSLDKGTGTGSVVDLTAAGDYDVAFLLVGNGCGKQACPVETTYTAAAPDSSPASWHVSGFWSYLTLDKRGAAFDPFGFIVGGMKTQLSDDAGLAAQSGHFSFLVATGEAFGWYVTSIDNKNGAGTALVAADIAPIPPPAAGLLLIGGLGAFGMLRLRRQPARG
ncbi:hypothetical protein BH23PSE1_BH23PSE1_16120 [soil metagenome]